MQLRRLRVCCLPRRANPPTPLHSTRYSVRVVTPLQALCSSRARARSLEACKANMLIINCALKRAARSAVPLSQGRPSSKLQLGNSGKKSASRFGHCLLRNVWVSSFVNQVDLAGYAPRYLGGHHQPHSRDAHFNDNCVCIALRARSAAFAPDMHEVYKAKWASRPVTSCKNPTGPLIIPQEAIAVLAAIAERYVHSPPPPSILIDGYTLLHENERHLPFVCGQICTRLMRVHMTAKNH